MVNITSFFRSFLAPSCRFLTQNSALNSEIALHFSAARPNRRRLREECGPGSKGKPEADVSRRQGS
jgi:hypothetical protein